MSQGVPAVTASLNRSGRLVSYFVGHPTAANIVLILMLVSGLVGISQIRTQFFPDTAREAITVTTTWPGAAPRDVDLGIAAILEPVLRAIDGVIEVRSRASDGSSRIDLDFEVGWDMERARDDVKNAIDGVTTLPEAVDDPKIRRSSYWDRVTDIVISGPIGIEQLVRQADRLRERLFADGVARTSVRGNPPPVIRVSVDDALLERYGLTLSELSRRIANESELIAIGELVDGVRIRAGSLARDAEAVAKIGLLTDRQGKQVTVGDIAKVRFDDLSQGEAYEVEGQPAVILRVERGLNDDAIEIQREVERIVSEFELSLPAGSQIQLTGARAEAIADRLDILWRNGLLGLVLVLGLLFLFLSARTAFWVAAGVPVAMFCAIALMSAAGTTLNMISLFALIITLGIVVDDAIVVGEHADALAAKGYSPSDAASCAARLMSGPVFAASITTVIAFASLLLIDGRMGRFILDIPVTVSLVLIASLIECFLILPAHMRHALSVKREKKWYDAPSRWTNELFEWFRQSAFKPALRFVIGLRYIFLSLAICGLLVTLSLFRDGSVGWRFFNAPERGTINANIAMLPGAVRNDTKAMLDEMQRALAVVDARFIEKYGRAPVSTVVATIGDGVGRGLRTGDDRDEDLLGGLQIELIDADERNYSVFEFITEWRSEIVSTPWVDVMSLQGERSGQGGDRIDIRLSGMDLATLKAASLRVQEQLAAFDAVIGLQDTLVASRPELNLELTDKGGALGFDTAMVARDLRYRLAGIEAFEFALGTRSAEILVEIDDSLKGSAYLDEARIRAPSGNYLPLREIVTITSQPGIDTIRRINGLNTVTIIGDISGDSAEIESEVRSALENSILPGIVSEFDVEYLLGGAAEDEREFLSDAKIGVSVALICIFVTLAWIFGSWTQPILILLVVPFGAIGMIWGHYWHDVPLSMFSVVGAIGMIGIIINDSIVLVTAANAETKRRAVIPSLVDAVCSRLRAVLLTTLTTVFGLAPLLFETSRQAQFLKPTVITLAYGLGFGMVMVLVITPIMLAVRHDIGMALKSLRRAPHVIRRRRTLGT